MQLIQPEPSQVTPASGHLGRIVVLERGPLLARPDLFGGNDQKLISQMPDESLVDFSARVVQRVRRSQAAQSATVLLGEDSNRSARHEMLRCLSRALVAGTRAGVEVIVRAGPVATHTVWQLLDEMTRDIEFRGVPLRMRCVS